MYWWKMLGKMNAIAASMSTELWMRTPRGLYSCVRKRTPPTKNASPSENSRFARIVPTSDALTTSTMPARSATKAMIISGAFPNVAFRSPPIVGPVRTAMFSVACTSHAASGTMASAADPKTTAEGTPCACSSTAAMGTNASNQFIGSRRKSFTSWLPSAPQRDSAAEEDRHAHEGEADQHHGQAGDERTRVRVLRPLHAHHEEHRDEQEVRDAQGEPRPVEDQERNDRGDARQEHEPEAREPAQEVRLRHSRFQRLRAFQVGEHPPVKRVARRGGGEWRKVVVEVIAHHRQRRRFVRHGADRVDDARPPAALEHPVHHVHHAVDDAPRDVAPDRRHQ